MPLNAVPHACARLPSVMFSLAHAGPALAFASLIARIPIQYMQLAVGVLLLLFGMRWLRKAILRAAGVIALHDEAEAFAEKSAALQTAQHAQRAWDAIAIVTAFKAV